MYSLIGLNPEEIASLRGRRVLTQGADPAWVRHAAEAERELPLLRAEQRAASKPQERRAGFVTRLRIAFGRA
jgi:hypothetical protein